MRTVIKHYYLLLSFIGLSLSLTAQIPSGYYDSAEGKSGAALKTALHSIISEQQVLSYSGVREALKYTDEDPNNSRNVLLLYTNWSYPKNNFGGGADQWNREHTWAKSQGNFGTSKGPGTDLHHLRPTDVTVNSKRGHLMFDNGGTFYTDRSRYGGGSGETLCRFDGDSWEPADRVKGDVARMMFYMAVRYEGSGKNSDRVDLELAEYSSPSGKHGRLSTLKVWHRNDPVNDWEIRRNNRIYEKQRNRNPFIDYPELAEYIWGDKVGEVWHSNQTLPKIILPKNGTVIDFNKVAYQQSTHKTIVVKAERLEGNLVAKLSGQNASEFSLSTSIITLQDAKKGKNLVITCRPTSIGEKTAILTISGGSASPISVQITAESTSTFLATAATDITGNSFVANWTESTNAQGYTLDVYTKENGGTTNQELLNEKFIGGLPSNWDKAGYIENLKTNGIRLASGKKIGKITTPDIDLSQPTTLQITTRQYNSDNNAILTIKIGDTTITDIKTTNETKTYTVNIPAQTSNKRISFSANNRKRVYIYAINISTKNNTNTKVSLNGFPKNVGNTTSYKVSQLTELQNYYYTVKPIGNLEKTSNEISVITNKTTSNIDKNSEENQYNWTIYNNRLTITTTEPTTIQLFDIAGKSLSNTIAQNQETTIILPKRGVYILTIKGKEEQHSTKILY